MSGYLTCTSGNCPVFHVLQDNCPVSCPVSLFVDICLCCSPRLKNPMRKSPWQNSSRHPCLSLRKLENTESNKKFTCLFKLMIFQHGESDVRLKHCTPSSGIFVHQILSQSYKFTLQYQRIYT